MPIEICMESDGLHAYFDRRQVIRSRAAAGSAKPPTRKRSEKSALMASVWGTLRIPYLREKIEVWRVKIARFVALRAAGREDREGWRVCK